MTLKEALAVATLALQNRVTTGEHSSKSVYRAMAAQSAEALAKLKALSELLD